MNCYKDYVNISHITPEPTDNTHSHVYRQCVLYNELALHNAQ